MAHELRTHIRLGGLAGAFALAIVLTACSSVAPSPGGSVNSVAIDQGDSTMQVGDTLALTATVDVSGGAADTVDWSSSDKAVATVDAGGTVSAVSGGTSTITATSTADSTQSDSITVTVLSTTVNPADIFVDAAAAAGGNGSSATPFQTVGAGLNAVDPGGTVHVAAGTYNEALYLGKAVDLEGAGEGTTTITTTAGAAAPGGGSTGAAIAVDGVDGLTLAGFTLDVQAPGPNISAITVYAASSNFTIHDVTINQADSNDNIGLALTGVSTADVTNVTVTDQSGSKSSAGILVDSGSTGVTLTGVTVDGHSGYAGIALDPRSGDLSNITIQNATLNQVNEMEVNLTGGGTVTALTAPQFSDVVRNSDASYGAGAAYFYKESEGQALSDSLFQFGSLYPQSYVQQVSGSDKTVLGDFVVGAASSGGTTRTNSIQTAIGQAAAGATIHVRSSMGSTFDGALTVNKALTITGAGGASQITAPAGSPVITVTGDPVVITGVDVNGNDNGSAAVAFDATAVPNLRINGSNLTSALAIDDTAGSSITPQIDATGNWWGQTGGPLTGQVVSPNSNVDTSTSLASPVP